MKNPKDKKEIEEITITNEQREWATNSSSSLGGQIYLADKINEIIKYINQYA